MPTIKCFVRNVAKMGAKSNIIDTINYMCFFRLLQGFKQNAKKFLYISCIKYNCA